MAKVLVTGAGGFIGKRLIRKLQGAGHEVIPVDRRNGDLSGAESWDKLPATDVLIHLAGRSYVPDSWRDTPGFMCSNIGLTGHALEYCRKHRARMVFVSAYVYGIPRKLPISEEDPVNPNNPYALSKRLAEELCEFYAIYHGVGVNVLRVFNVFGPGQRSEFLIPEILRQIEGGKEIRLKDLKPRRDYVYIDDVVEALERTVNVTSGFNIINIGSGVSLSVGEIIDQIQQVTGTTLTVVSEENERPQEIPDVQADISRALDILGWRPRHTFRAGVQAILERKDNE